jgi:hypothetical protein
MNCLCHAIIQRNSLDHDLITLAITCRDRMADAFLTIDVHHMYRRENPVRGR